jgi:pyridine nucleotide-disulfide oxidoreductase family protein
MQSRRQILLIGGGHAHVEVLRRFAISPDPGVSLTLVSPYAAMGYSGMVPGLVAGHYRLAETQVQLAPLADSANARFIVDRVVALDLASRKARLDAGRHVDFDLASLDVGSTPDTSVPGATEYALAVKPLERFLAESSQLLEQIATGAVRKVAVVGGGAGGVEVLLAMQHRTRSASRGTSPEFALISDRPRLLSAAVRKRLARALTRRGVGLHLGHPAVAVEPGGVRIAGNQFVAADRVVWAISAAAAPWLAASGLACDARGFVLLDDCLRSTSHDFVFAAGDCATQQAHPRPKSGVYAVRQGPPLAENLRLAASDQPLRPYVPQRQALALISTGDKHAIASWGPFAIEGDWVWRWKDRIDRRFMARYDPAALSSSVGARRPAD